MTLIFDNGHITPGYRIDSDVLNKAMPFHGNRGGHPGLRNRFLLRQHQIPRGRVRVPAEPGGNRRTRTAAEGRTIQRAIELEAQFDRFTPPPSDRHGVPQTAIGSSSDTPRGQSPGSPSRNIPESGDRTSTGPLLEDDYSARLERGRAEGIPPQRTEIRHVGETELEGADTVREQRGSGESVARHSPDKATRKRVERAEKMLARGVVGYRTRSKGSVPNLKLPRVPIERKRRDKRD